MTNNDKLERELNKLLNGIQKLRTLKAEFQLGDFVKFPNNNEIRIGIISDIILGRSEDTNIHEFDYYFKYEIDLIKRDLESVVPEFATHQAKNLVPVDSKTFDLVKHLTKKGEKNER